VNLGAASGATGALGSPAAAAAAGGPRPGASDIARFEAALMRVEAGTAATAPASAGVQALMKPFGHLDAQAASLSAKAARFVASGSEMTPGDMIMMTVRSHEFMFHCQLTSNAANRTSDGLQQLFRQQA
jgi:hypothetical protein